MNRMKLYPWYKDEKPNIFSFLLVASRFFIKQNIRILTPSSTRFSTVKLLDNPTENTFQVLNILSVFRSICFTQKETEIITAKHIFSILICRNTFLRCALLLSYISHHLSKDARIQLTEKYSDTYLWSNM